MINENSTEQFIEDFLKTCLPTVPASTLEKTLYPNGRAAWLEELSKASSPNICQQQALTSTTMPKRNSPESSRFELYLSKKTL